MPAVSQYPRKEVPFTVPQLAFAAEPKPTILVTVGSVIV
jgi:hypothetical protein